MTGAIDEKLTAKQQEFLAFLYEQAEGESDGIPPTIATLARRLGISRQSCGRRVHALARKGKLTVKPYEPRGIRLCE
jgi:Mn-dependent DtxR family transcriptional regulator